MDIIIDNLVETMALTTSIQPDIDEVKVEAAARVAQDIDITRIIGKANVERCLNPQDSADEELLELLTPALCWFTSYRLLKLYGFVFTDGGTTEEDEEASKKNDKRASEAHAVGETYLQEVLDFLENENPDDLEVAPEKMTPSVRVVGGTEIRASN